MVRVGSCWVVCAVVALVAADALTGPLAQDARADNLPITDRNYAIDLYDGVAIGNTAMVGMGGAGAALINGTAGALINRRRSRSARPPIWTGGTGTTTSTR